MAKALMMTLGDIFCIIRIIQLVIVGKFPPSFLENSCEVLTQLSSVIVYQIGSVTYKMQ